MRTHKLKDNYDCVKVEHGDILKFGRVRFRVKKLVVDQASVSDKNAKGKGSKVHTLELSHMQRLESLGNESMLSRRSTQMDQMVRMHSSANYSFDI